MKPFLVLFCVATISVSSIYAEDKHRERRQAAEYRFPGPRTRSEYSRGGSNYEDILNSQPAPGSRGNGPQSYRPVASNAYSPQSYGRPSSSAPPPTEGYEPAPRPYRKQTVQSFGLTSNSESAEEKARLAEEEEEQKKPDKLAILLQSSKFTCSGKKDGYYADNTINCEVFHYCVSGAKHSWMCPEGTVFHQVHLNCVPASQDICSQSEKYSERVNEYLYKAYDQRGPNNTVRYHQRFYPEEFLGDPLIGGYPEVQEFPPRQPQPQAQPRPQPRPQPQARPQPQPRPSYNNEYDSYSSEDDGSYRNQQPPAPSRAPKLYSLPYQPQPKPIQSPSPAYKPVSRSAPPPKPYTLPAYRQDTASASNAYPGSSQGRPQSIPVAHSPTPVNKPPLAYSPPHPTQPAYSAAPVRQPNSGLSYLTSSQYGPQPTHGGAATRSSSSPGNSYGYPTSYPAPGYSSGPAYDSSESAARPRFNSGRTPLRSPTASGENLSGVTYEEEY